MFIPTRWLLAYRDALSFRSSHYFVSYLSEATALAAGIDLSHSKSWAVTVTRPWNIELPRSLVEVVINWNIPMHTWLKTCKSNLYYIFVYTYTVWVILKIRTNLFFFLTIYLYRSYYLIVLVTLVCLPCF